MPARTPVMRWTPNRAAPTGVGATAAPSVPSLASAVARGLRARCPSCGIGRIFAGYLTVVPACSACQAPLGAARADDLPPYLTILVTGHIVVPLMLWLERAQSPSTLSLSAIFLPLTVVLALGLLRPIKGGTVGLMMKLGLMKPEADLE